MATLADLLFRVAVNLALLAVLGAGPAALLHGTQAGTRIALAPALGLALGAAVLLSIGSLISMGTAAWAVLLPMSVVSVGTALTIQRGRARSDGARNSDIATGLKIGLVLVVVASALSYPLAHRDSLGPVAYRVSDATWYVALADRFESHSISDRTEGPPWDLTASYGNGVAQVPVSALGVSALAASVDAALGWRAADTQSSWLIVLVAVIALGAFAAVQEFTASRTWAAPLAGVLMAGPFMYQLFVDSSQGALSALALFPSLAILGDRVIARPRAVDVTLIAVLFAGGLALYPAGVPGLVVWAAAILALIGLHAGVRRRLRRDAFWKFGRIALLIGVLAIALVPVAFRRAIDFYQQYAEHKLDSSGVPYNLPLEVIPSWLFQTRDLYGIDASPTALESLSRLVVTLLIPGVFVAVAVFGVLKYRRSWILVAVIPTAAVLAYSAYLRNQGLNPTYPVNRNMLVVAIAVAILIAVGVAALASTERKWARVAAVVIAAVALGFAGRNAYVVGDRVLQAGHIVPASVRQALPYLKDRPGVLYLEALGARYPDATLEMPAIYDLVNEATPNRLEVDMMNNDNRGPLYFFGWRRNEEPWFEGSYRWVLTPASDVKTSRTVVARVGSLAIERRTRPLDVTAGSGIAIDPRDPNGNAWIVGQLWLRVTGAPEGRVWARLEIEGRDVRPVGPPGSRVVARRPDRVVVCVPVGGSGAVRRTVASFGFEPGSRPPTPSGYALPTPDHSLKLAGMWAVRRCAGSRTGPGATGPSGT